MKRFMMLIALIIMGCGGGGGSSGGGGTVVIPPNNNLLPVSRAGLYYSYFGDCDNAAASSAPPYFSCITETSNQVNMTLDVGFGIAQANDHSQSDIAARHLVQDQSLGITTSMVGLSEELYSYQNGTSVYIGDAEAIPKLQAYFTQLRSLGVLQNIVAFYPIDEPNLNVGTEADVIAANKVVRQVMTQFSELSNTKLAAIYAPFQYGGWKGISSYDWVGFDDYSPGNDIFTNGEFDNFEQMLSPSQQIILVPGGASNTGKIDPTVFYNKAQTDMRVVAIVAFVYFDLATSSTPILGIRDDGLAKDYCTIGQMIKTPGLSESSVKC